MVVPERPTKLAPKYWATIRARLDAGEIARIAGIVILNTPAASTADLVRQHFIVRTTVDGVPVPADVETTRAPGLASGAQILSTDFPVAADAGAPAFDLPGGTPSRCNPVNAPTNCTSSVIENTTDLVDYRP